jgi:hypothetical protein
VGELADCGRVVQTVGNTVTCSLGQTTCDGVTWGACLGDLKANSFTIPLGGGGLRFESLGAQNTCANNPCDPDCNQFVDTPTGVDAGSDALAVGDSGLQILGGACNPAIAPCAVVTCGDGIVGGAEQCETRRCARCPSAETAS